MSRCTLLTTRQPAQLDNLEELLLNNPSQHYNIMIGDLNLLDIRPTWHNNKGEVASHSKRRAFHQRALAGQ